MCGFAGEARFDSSVADIGIVARMGDVLHNRGPDATGAFQQGPIALAHRRLSIIDLSAHAQQPMTDSALGLTLVFNGCIYNYRELRIQLETLGYRFFSDGDTEVVLKGFHAWGPDCVQRFHGMFAFALWERDSGRLTLVRDRFGIKPLYLAPVSGGLRFASSLPALLAGGGIDTSIDPVALHHYMSWHAVVPPPLTILAGVRKLPPATLATFESDGTRSDVEYWRLSVRADPKLEALDAREREALVERALSTAVQRRMVADVPVGVLLSGGVDSSLIVALLAEHGQHGLQTFSIGFEPAYGEAGDEFGYSNMVAECFDTRHHRIRIPTPDLVEVLPATIAAMSEPMVSYDNVGFFLLSREVARHVKVVQSGQGADEVFAGYDWYAELAATRDAGAAPANYARAFFDRTHEDYLNTVRDRWLTDDVSGAFVKRHFARADAGSPVEKALHLDSTVMLPDDPVKRVDNMTMAWSLEARVPFLDHELVELAGRLPVGDKLADGGKGVLKSIARKRLPREVVDRPKGYFPVPALKYLEGPVLAMVRDVLGSRAARERGLFRPEAIQPWLDAPGEHITRLRGSKLWQVGLLELWLREHGL
jgi:asparagine synthase (glutamine-hydrolysing)